MPHANSRFLILIAMAVALAGSGCLSAAMRAGQQAEVVQDYDQAVIEYTRVLREKPGNVDARRALERAKLRAAQDHLTNGRRFAANGRLDEALVELQTASELNPGSADIEETLRTVRTQQRNKIAVVREGKTQLETLVDRAREQPAQGAQLPVDVKLPASLTFPNASARTVYLSIGRLANISIVFDSAFRDQSISIDLRDATLPGALDAVSNATRNFYRVNSDRVVTIIPDTAAKRREYEEEVIKTFYLSNADLKETIDALRTVVDARRIAPITGTNALTLKDTPERVEAAAKLIAAIDKARPEVVIDVQLLEVDRTRLKEYGLQLASPGSAGINGAADINRDNFTVRDLRTLSQSDVFLTNLPGVYYRLLKQDSNTRTLANPQLRTMEGITTAARWGERVPVPQTTFAPIATGGINQQPITSYAYENIGVNLDITPRMHHDDEVSLALKIEVSSIAGEGFGGLPKFGNRTVSTVIRLRDGETNMLAGLIRDDERRVVRGIPGLSDIPGIGSLFSHTQTDVQQTDVILTLTPHIIRVLDLSEQDLRAFRVARDQTGFVGAAVDLPAAPLPPPDPAQQPAAPAQQPQPGQQQPGTFILQQPGTVVQPPGPSNPSSPRPSNPSPPAPTRP
jgi:general secretion pathway protein D